MKKITLYLVMLLIGFSGFSQVETFDDPSVVAPVTPGPWILPTGTWHITDNGVGPTVNWTLNPQDTYPAHSGTKAAYMNRMNIGAGNTSEDYLITPLLTTPQDPQLRFFTRTTIAGQTIPNSTIYQIRSAPATADPTDFTAFTTIVAQWNENELTDTFDVYEEKVVDITDPVGTQKYYAFVRVFTQPTPAPAGDRWLVDDFKFISKCLDVTNVTAACLSTSSVLSWQSAGAATQWAVHVLPADAIFDPTAGNPLITNSNSNFTVTQTTQPTVGDLVPLTDYVFYVQALCPNSGSEWVSVACTTQAAPPVCGGNYVDSGGVDGEYSNSESTTTTICPQNIGDQVTVTFTAFNTEATWDGIYVYDGNSALAPMIPSDLGPGNGPMAIPGGYWGTNIPGPFTSSSPDGCLTFVFVSDGGGTRDGFESNVTCGPPPACPKPGLLTAVDINPTDATVSWANNGPGTSWEVLVLPANAPAPTSASTGVAGTSAYNITNLTSSTCYDVYVRADCSSTTNGLSTWAGPLEICTPALPPVCGGNYVDIGGIDGPYNPGMNEITTICPETPGDVVTVHFTFLETENSFDGFYVFNGDSITDPIIPSTNGPGFNNNLSAPGAFWGNIIPDDFQSSSPDGCLTFQFISDGSFQQGGYSSNVTCGPPPPCPKPSAIVINSTTALTATVSFTNNGLGTLWDIIALPCGSPAPAANAVGQVIGSASSSNVVVPGLEADTCYDFYVRANCESSDNGLSDWAGPRPATTQIAPPVCGGNFVDVGGVDGPYDSGMNMITTICPEVPGDVVTVHFTFFETEDNWDGFYVFNGSSTSSPLIPSTNGAGFNNNFATPGAFWGNVIPDDFQSSSPDGCLTFQFISDGIFEEGGFYADVICGPPPPCPKPTAVVINSTTSFGATVSFTNNGPGTLWDIIAVPCGSAAPAADAVGQVVGSTVTVNVPVPGLEPDTCYDFYVRANCESSDNGLSDWSGPRTATTQVAPPVCGGTYVDLGGVNGNYPSNANSTVTVCPTIPGEVVTVTFTSFETEAQGDGLYVFDGPTTASPLIPSNNGPGFGNLTQAGAYWGNSIPPVFQSTSPDGCLTFTFISSGFFELSGFEANVTCGPPPVCIRPTQLVPSQLTVNSVQLDWVNNGPATSWQVIALPCGSPLPDDSSAWVDADTNSFVLGGLQSSTCYDFYVRANCTVSEDGYSLVTGPQSGNTLVAPPECGGIFADNGGADPYEANSNYTVTVCPETPGEIVTVVFTSFETEQNWDALYVYDGPGIDSPQISSGNPANNVPGGLPGGFWGFNVPGPFQSTSPDGCLTFTFRSDGSGQYAGWSANVSCSACPIPLQLTAIQPYTYGALLDWNTVDGATYDLIILPAGSPAPADNAVADYTGILSSAVPFQTTIPLTQLTDYDFYVRAVCPGGTESSPWAQPGSFTTLPTCPAPVNITSATTTQSAIIQWTEVGPATQWEVWIVPSGSPVPVFGTGDIVTMDPAINPIEYNTLTGPGGEILFPGLYDFYVHSICSDTDSSILAGPHEFYILNVDPICAEVTPSNPDINSDGVINLCPGESCVDLTATFVDNRATDSYVVESIPFAPPFPFDGGIELDISTDDIWGPVFELPFNFCFFGVNYTSVKVGSNGVVTFNNDSDTYCPYALIGESPIPNPDFPILNAIYGVYQDINPNVETPVVHTINYQVLGTAPCRVFVINYVNIAQFSCNLNAPLQTSQIVLYETSNNVEVYVKDRVSCTSWNGGLGVIGIQNTDGSLGYSPPGRNLGTWEAHDEAWKFKPDGASNVVFSWLMGTEFYSSDVTINVCVSELTTMTAQAVYNGCGGVITTKSADVILSPQVIDVLPIDDVTQCDPYTLLPINGAGNYFTEPGGLGTPYFAGDVISASQTMYVYAFITANGETCSDEESFEIIIGGQAVTTPGHQIVCEEYILQDLETGGYYGQADGIDPIPVGTHITDTATIWVFAPSDVGCPAQGSFLVTVNKTPVLVDPATDIVQCSPYTFPTPTVGHYYDGPGGTGNILDGTTVSAPAVALPVYLYAPALAPCLPAEMAFTISVQNGIVADTPVIPVSANCSFTLPVLSAGNSYWTLPGGTGQQLFAGDFITTPGVNDIFVYVAATADCPASENSYQLTITPAPVLAAVSDLSDCNSVTLPALTVGSYYEDAAHLIPLANTTFSTPGVSTVYVYAQTNNDPACSSSAFFTVNIGTPPQVDEPLDVVACGSYSLPALGVGSYYGATGGQSPLTNLVITTPGVTTVYVYQADSANVSCFDESSFTVEITPAPVVNILGECQGADFVLTALDGDNNAFPAGTTFQWQGQDGALDNTASITVTQEGTYTVTVGIASGTDFCSSDGGPFVVTSTSCTIQKGISANNDGLNDYFDLVGQNVGKLEIYNRYGMKVYEMNDYSNQWYGQSDKGEELPDGTYYYVIMYKDAMATKTGWIYINRKN